MKEGEKIYEKFHRLCELRGVTPYVVSKETGIPQSTLSDWKNGRYTPKADKMLKIAEYFDVPLEYLVG